MGSKRNAADQATEEDAAIHGPSRTAASTSTPPYLRLSIRPVLPESLTCQTVPLVEGFLVMVSDKRKMSKLMSALKDNNWVPPEFSHLKRVVKNESLTANWHRKTEHSAQNDPSLFVLVGVVPNPGLKSCSIDENQQISGDRETEILSHLNAIFNDNLSNPLLSTKLHRHLVPAEKPRTQAQYQFCRAHWPTSFLYDPVLEAKLSGRFFADETDAIRRMHGRVETTGGALFYNPETREIVAEGRFDPTRPLSHAVMAAIERLAEQQLLQGSGPSGTRQKRRRLIDDGTMDGGQHRSRQKYEVEQDEDGEYSQYLATGFDAFLDEEPCAMCAMALAHCRTRRVFFNWTNRHGVGALVGSARRRPPPTKPVATTHVQNAGHQEQRQFFRVQELPELNHRFEVYHISRSSSSLRAPENDWTG